MLVLLLDAVTISCAAFYLRYWLRCRKSNGIRGYPYPPGPKPLPFVGNVLDMPSSEEWEKARQWGEQYGDLVMVENFGTRYLFINSYEAAIDLLEKRGNNYSTRPFNAMLELEDWVWFTSLMPYGDEHRKSRQQFHRFFQQSVVSEFYDVQTASARGLLLALLEEPTKFAEHIRYAAGEAIMKIAYGYQAQPKNDPYINLAEAGLEAVGVAQGFFLVTAVPILKYLPEWFPGAGFLTTARKARETSRRMRFEPFAMAKDLIASGKSSGSLTSNLLDQNTNAEGQVSNEDLISKTVGTAYAAGADTTVSALLTFMLAMVLYPEAMRRGQRELDDVLGKDTIPTMDDRPRLPYINAICKEVLRYQPVAPLAAAHCTSEDDIYNGYLIPAGTAVFPNVWAMTRDPDEYPEPNKFKPERWIVGEGEKHPLEANRLAFGFGRRICSGRHFAENTIFISVASILATFDIGMAADDDGTPLVPKEEYTPNFLRHPKPFKCRIVPRSGRSEEIIRQAIETVH